MSFSCNFFKYYEEGLAQSPVNSLMLSLVPLGQADPVAVPLPYTG